MGPGGDDAFASAARTTQPVPCASAHQPNPSHNPNMNHNMNLNIRKTSQYDARVAFELTHPFAPSDPTGVWRIRYYPASPVPVTEGIILESDHQKPRTVVVNARIGDIVAIRHKAAHQSMAAYLCYIIDYSLKPRFIENFYQPFKSLGFAAPASRTEADGRVMNHDENDLKSLLRGKHPRWLQKFVDGQLLRWREHLPAEFVRLAPREWLDRDVILVAVHDPYLAVKDYRDRLTEKQLEFCIRRLPPGAARLLFAQIPRKLRSKHLKQHATYILENHLHQLSDAELRRCSWGDPLTAFKTRHVVSARRSAIMLASTYPVAWIPNHGTSKADLRNEIFDSLLQYPDVWLKSNTKGIEYIFKRLNCRLGIRFEVSELAALLGQMPPIARSALAKYISSRI